MRPGNTPRQGQRSIRRYLVLSCLTLLLCLAGPGRAGQPGPVTPDKKGQPTPPTPPAVKGLEALKLPGNAIIVVCEQAADGLRMLPRFVVLTPEKFKELQDELDRLKARPKVDKPVPPSFCHLEGKVEGHLAHLEARFDFRTEVPNALVTLGCRQAQLTRASLDGKTPLLRAEPDGYVVQVPEPGGYQLTVNFTLALAVTGSSRALELDLPRAAGTTLKLHLPGEVKELRVNDKPLAETLLDWKNGLLEGPHGPGPVDKLALAWKGTSTTPGGPTVLAAEGRIHVRLDDQLLPTAEARLQLKVQGGQTKQWRLLVPTDARIKLAPADEERVTVESKEFPTCSLRTLRLKEPSADPLTITVQWTAKTPLPRTGTGRLSVGPFALVGAARQTGTLLVSTATANLQLVEHRQGYTTRRELTADELKLGARVLGFNYELPPLTDNPPFVEKGTGAASPSLLDLEVEAVRGLIETRVAHVLRLLRKEREEDKREWRAQTTIDAKLIQPGAGQLVVQLPPDWVYVPVADARWPDAIREVRYDEEKRLIQMHLATDGWKPFQVTLRSRYGKAVEDEGTALLALARPVGTASGGGQQVTVTAPDDLQLNPARADPLLQLVRQSPQEQVWRADPAADRPADQVEVSWRPYRPDVRARSVVNLDLRPRQGQVLRHELRLEFPREPPDRVYLRVPPVLANRVTLVEGGTLKPEEPNRPGLRPVDLKPGRSGSEVLLVLEYSFPLPEEEAPKVGPDGPPAGGRGRGAITVPLVTADASTSGETRVRVLSEPGLRPLPGGGDWAELKLEEIKGESRLPALVLLSSRPEKTLPLRLGDPGGASPATVLVERALIRVRVVEGEGQDYRASFRLSQLNASSLDVELPAPVAEINLRVELDGKQPHYVLSPQAEGNDPGSGRGIRLELSGRVKPGSVLEISYSLPPLRRGGSLVQTLLQPPRLLGELGRVLTRWQVNLPPGWVVLSPEGGPGSERTWARRGWLLFPHLAQTSSDLERWFAADVVGGGREEAEAVVVPSLLCWRSGLEPVGVVHVPQQGWLVFCSALVLGLGLTIYFGARQPGKGSFRWGRVWLALGVVALGLVTASVFWPTLLAAVLYGCQPGLVVVVLVCLVEWLLQERNRRRIVFLPSFSRSRSGSSLVRGTRTSSAGKRRAHGEPSTVDEPKPV